MARSSSFEPGPEHVRRPDDRHRQAVRGLQDDALGGQLAAAVGRNGAGVVVFGPRPVRSARPGGGDAGDEDEALELRRGAEAGLDEMPRPFDVGRFEGRFAGRLDDPGQMEDVIPVRDGGGEGGGIAEVADDELDGLALERPRVARPADEADDVVAAMGEGRRQPPSDEPAGPRDQGFHDPTSKSRPPSALESSRF